MKRNKHCVHGLRDRRHAWGPHPGQSNLPVDRTCSRGTGLSSWPSAASAEEVFQDLIHTVK